MKIRWMAALIPVLALGIIGTLLVLLMVGRQPTMAAATATATATTTMAATACVDVSRAGSYAISYESVAALTRSATLVVVGTVSSVERVEAKGSSDFAVTDFQVTVETTLLSRLGGGAEKTITVQQEGGAIGCRHYINLDDRLMPLGERDVFFLRQVTRDTYVTLGPQGRFLVAAGQVQPANTMGPSVPANETLADFEGQVTGLRASVTERYRAAYI